MHTCICTAESLEVKRHGLPHLSLRGYRSFFLWVLSHRNFNQVHKPCHSNGGLGFDHNGLDTGSGCGYESSHCLAYDFVHVVEILVLALAPRCADLTCTEKNQLMFWDFRNGKVSFQILQSERFSNMFFLDFITSLHDSSGILHKKQRQQAAVPMASTVK